MTAPSRALRPRSSARFRPPRFGLGGAPIGDLPANGAGDSTATATVDAAYNAGIRFFATAPGHGDGRSEARFGTALASHPRGEFLVSTKVVAGLTADGIRDSLRGSLDRLGLPSIDLVFLLDPDERTALETYPAVLELRDRGVVGAIGAAGNDWRQLDAVVRDLELDAVLLLGGRYSLLDQSAAPLLDRCRARGVAAMVAGILTPEIRGLDQSTRPAGTAVIRARRLAAVCDRYGVSLPQAALAFPSRHSAVTSVIIGAATPAEVRAAAALVRRPVPDQLWRDPELAGLLAAGQGR